jgi:hypothetical protein
MAHAQTIISKEAMRARELQPYSSTVDAMSLSPRGKGRGGREWDEDQERRRLMFGGDGEVEMDSQGSRKLDFGRKAKRRELPVDEDEDEGEKTETDEVDVPSFPSAHSNNDFPPVFSSSTLSHPDLLHVPAIPKPKNASVARLTKGLPRSLGKTMSAPVGQLGSRFGGGQPDVDMDGFDLKEWAEKEEF